MRILLVEDDRMIADGVRKALRADGWATDWVADGAAALSALGLEQYDLVLLDLGLPKRDGLDVLRSLRASGNKVPVLICTARDAVADRVSGLDAGADDYLVKPFDFGELLAALAAAHYDGWLVVEAEQDPTKAPPLAYARLGFAHRTCAGCTEPLHAAPAYGRRSCHRIRCGPGA